MEGVPRDLIEINNEAEILGFSRRKNKGLIDLGRRVEINDDTRRFTLKLAKTDGFHQPLMKHQAFLIERPSGAGQIEHQAVGVGQGINAKCRILAEIKHETRGIGILSDACAFNYRPRVRGLAEKHRRQGQYSPKYPE